MGLHLSHRTGQDDGALEFALESFQVCIICERFMPWSLIRSIGSFESFTGVWGDCCEAPATGTTGVGDVDACCAKVAIGGIRRTNSSTNAALRRNMMISPDFRIDFK